MSRRRTTFGKLQRDREKQARQQAKQQRRAERAEQRSDDDTADTGPEVDQATVLAQLAELHAEFDDGKISLDDFEVRRDELRNSLRVD